MRKRLASIWLLSPRGGTPGLVAGGQGPSHHCQPGWEHGGWHLIALCRLTSYPEGGDWVAGASEGISGTQRHKGLTDYSLGPVLLVDHALTRLVAVACKKHRNGTMDCLFHFR